MIFPIKPKTRLPETIQLEATQISYLTMGPFDNYTIHMNEWRDSASMENPFSQHQQGRIDFKL